MFQFVKKNILKKHPSCYLIVQVLEALGDSFDFNVGDFRIDGWSQAIWYQRDEMDKEQISYPTYWHILNATQTLTLNIQDGMVKSDASIEKELSFICQGINDCSGNGKEQSNSQSVEEFENTNTTKMDRSVARTVGQKCASSDNCAILPYDNYTRLPCFENTCQKCTSTDQCNMTNEDECGSNGVCHHIYPGKKEKLYTYSRNSQ